MNKPNILVVIFDTLRYDYFQKFLSEDPVLSEIMKDFVSYGVETKLSKFLNHDYTFSECFGMQHSKSLMRKHIQSIRGTTKIYEDANIPRKTIIKQKIKLSVNTHSKLEEYSSQQQTRISDLHAQALNDLLFELEIFSDNNNFIIDKQSLKIKREENNEQKI